MMAPIILPNDNKNLQMALIKHKKGKRYITLNLLLIQCQNMKPGKLHTFLYTRSKTPAATTCCSLPT